MNIVLILLFLFFDRLGKHLIQNEGLSVKNIHLIGHSLGAQTCSYIANGIEAAHGKVIRITGKNAEIDIYV